VDGRSRVVLTPDAGVKLAEVCRPNRARTSYISADDGGKRARSPRRARRKPLKPLRAGMPGDPGATVVTTLVCYQHTAHEAAGATGTRHSHALYGGERFINDSGARAARPRNSYPKLSNVIASAAKQSILSFRGEMDCFAALAMTISRLLISLLLENGIENFHRRWCAPSPLVGEGWGEGFRSIVSA